MTTPHNKRQIMIDASALKESSCMRRMKHLVLDGLKAKDESTWKMDYGTAFHLFLQEWMDHGDTAKAMARAVDYYSKVYVPESDWRTLTNLVATMEAYVKNYTPDSFQVGRTSDGRALVEQKFCIPLFSTAEVEILAAGTQDALGRYNGEICAMDHKTTSITKYDDYLRGYELSTQMLFYRWINDYLACLYPETYGIMKGATCVVNGIFINKSAKPVFKRQTFDFPRHVMESFEKSLFQFCSKLAWAYVEMNFPQEGFINNACNSFFGPCAYRPLCVCPDNVSVVDVEEAMYERREYNPLTWGQDVTV